MRKDSLTIIVFTAIFWMLSVVIEGHLSYADNSASACINTTVNNDAANDCYTVTPPKAGATIFNGTEDAGEWTEAKVKNLSGTPSGNVKVLRSSDSIYLFITANDATYNSSDQIRIFIDFLHSHGSTGDDIEFRIKRDTGGSPDHRKVTAAGDNAWNPATLGSALGRSSAVGSWTAEVKLTASELGVSDLPPIMGIGVQVEDNPAGNIAVWPANFNNLSPATTWANLKTRYPIEYMIVLDQSGSMLSQNKWNDAKKAANFMANAMAILRDATYFTDKIGVVTFSWNCSGNTNETTTPKPLAAILAFPLGNYTDAAPAVGSPLNCTPIGQGLDAAFAALGTGAEETQRVVLFLSDGLHNEPDGFPAGEPDNVPLLPGHLSYNPCALDDWAVCASSVVQVNTVALGQDWGVDTGLLTNIKNAFTGEFDSTYNITTDVEVLKETFISSLDNLYQMNLASSGPSGAEFTVDPNNRKLIVILSWTTPAGAASFSMQQKTNPGDPWNNVACVTSATENTTVGYAICTVNNPLSGSWRAVDGIGNPVVAADRQFVLLDLNLRARFAIDQQVHGTGRDIILTADLNEAGVPVTNDPASHPVKVTVAIRRPGEGFGTYVSTRTLDSCEEQAPKLPPVQKDVNLTHERLSTGTFTAASTSTSPQPSGADVKPARFAKIDALFKHCNKEGLVFVEDPGIELYDDGTHGDVTPKDGIYTLQFLNTQYEGSYVFRFKASGVSPSGSLFSRVKTMAEYVRVEVDPSQTNFDSRIYQQAGNLVVKEYYVTPRDKFGGYLGPGYPDQIQFYTTGGQWASPLIDYNNGIYSRLLSYDRTQGQPDVTPIVQDKPIKPSKAAIAPSGGIISPYLIGTFDLRHDRNTVLSVINPTAKNLRIMVALFDDNERPLKCIQDKLSPNDLLEIDMFKHELGAKLGVVKVVSLNEKEDIPELGIVGYQRHFFKQRYLFFFQKKVGVTETILQSIPEEILLDDLKYIWKICK